MKFKLNNQKGISIVQVMIALALLAVAQVALMRFSKTQNKTVKTTEVKFESINALNSIKEVLADKSACYNTFGITESTPENLGTYDPNLIAPGVITEIRGPATPTTPGGILQYQSNLTESLAPQIGSSKLKILSFRINSSAIGAIGVDSKAVTEVFVNFHRGEVFGSETIEKRFRLNVRTDSVGDMVDCSTAFAGDGIQATAKYTCETLGGTYLIDGRGPGLDDCHTISPNQTTTFMGPVVAANGDVTINDTFGLNLLSDKSLKHNVLELENSLKKIRKLRPVSYNWNKNGSSEIGFIAQEVESVYPDFVKRTSTGYLSVKYPQMVSAALMGIKELDQINKKNLKEIKKLKREQSSMKRDFKLLKRSLCEIQSDIALCKKGRE